MLHCLNNSGNRAGRCSDMTVLERQRARMKWQKDHHHHHHQQQQHQHHQGHFSATVGFNAVFSSSLQVQSAPSLGSMTVAAADSGSSLVDLVSHSIKPDPSSGTGWPKLDKFVMGFGSSGLPPAPAPAAAAASGFDVNSAISRTSSCPPSLAEAKEKMSSSTGKEGFKKRKAEKVQNTKVVAENDNKDKRIKVGADDGEPKITGQTSTKNNALTANKNNTETCCDNSTKENSKASEVQKPDYIHVRARRGQATDSHSLAERVRREKISERMKYLQDLVPGCNKITGKAGMLDEIINYVQSLQRQVEFLSMKLAAVNPRLDFNIDDLFAKEVFPACAASFPAIGMSSDMANRTSYLHFNSPQQIVSGYGLDAGINPPDMGLRRTISAPVSMPETFVDSSCFTQILPSSTWEGDFQNLYNVAFDQARAASFPSQLFTGLVEPSNLKMEM